MNNIVIVIRIVIINYNYNNTVATLNIYSKILISKSAGQI
jgi:hypothetical protein